MIAGREALKRNDLLEILSFINIKLPNARINLFANSVSDYNALLRLSLIKNLRIIIPLYQLNEIHNLIALQDCVRETEMISKPALNIELRIIVNEHNPGLLLTMSELIAENIRNMQQVVISYPDYFIDFIGSKSVIDYSSAKRQIEDSVELLKHQFKVKIRLPYCMISAKYHPYVDTEKYTIRKLMNISCLKCRFGTVCCGMPISEANKQNSQSESKVALIISENYSNVKENILKSVQLLGGFEKYIPKNSMVAIKPNLMAPVSPDRCATTNPLFLRAIIELVKEHTPNVYVVENAGKEALLKTGIKKILDETNIPYINTERFGFIEKKVGENLVLDSAIVSELILFFDVIINLPKLKTHPITYLTCAIKNSYGFVEESFRQKCHHDFEDRHQFSKALIDISNVINPELNIVDMIDVQEGEGPLDGKARNLGFILTGQSPLFVDIAAAKITNHKPLDIPTISGFSNIGELTKGLEILGDENRICLDFEKHPNFKHKGKLKLIINKEKCTRCESCLIRCPEKAINLDKFEIDYEKCINCYCCTEFCRNNSIKIKGI
jgi:uncharacterized protein (DUF362 family)